MPDALSPDEIAAIRAFPKRRIQRIPRGVSGLTSLAWDEASGSIRDPSGLRWTPWGVKKPKTPPPPTTPKKPSRQLRAPDINGRILAMWNEGVSGRAIAAEIGISRHAVDQRIEKMRKAGASIPRRLR
jgi:hypothetical protein